MSGYGSGNLGGFVVIVGGTQRVKMSKSPSMKGPAVGGSSLSISELSAL